MLYSNVQITAHSLRFIDSLALSIAAVVAWFTVHGSGHWSTSIAVYVAIDIAAFLALGHRLRIYRARRTEEVVEELVTLCEVALYASALACLATQVFTQGLGGQTYSRIILTGLASVLALRLVMRFVIRRLRRRGGDERHWLIVGQNRRSAEIAREVLSNPHMGIRIDQIVDVNDSRGGMSQERRRFEASAPQGVKLGLVDDVEQLREIIVKRFIDEVVITLPVRTHYDAIRRLLELCCAAGISVRIRPQVFETVGFATEVSNVGNIPMVTHYNGPADYGRLMVKRLIDVIGSALGLLLLMPFLVAIAVAIKLSSPGPVFFRQTRVGLHGRHFEMVKFRSMVKDALAQREQLEDRNEANGTAFKIKDDARITPLGKWLRKYHIDELPQLWNVLMGDMSLVGPRPFPVGEAVGWEWWQRRRLTMQPGLTCLWQIEDDHAMPFEEWMELDMKYIDKWSLWLDLKLIVRTFGTIIRGSGW